MHLKVNRFIKWLILTVIAIVTLVIVALTVSPWPSAYLVSRLFSGPVVIQDATSYDVAKQHVIIQKNILYPSYQSKNTLDVYTPKGMSKPTTLVIWVHGGGYVGGDKSGVQEFATRLVNDTHVAFFSINYQTAPAAIYPSQVKQLNDAVLFLKKDARLRERYNFQQTILGGDSAGAQIALQYAAVQTNSQYAKSLGMARVLHVNQLRATVSYCGPLDLQQIRHEKSASIMMKWFINTVAWSELGTQKWQSSTALQQVSLVQHVNKAFPPTYITDGNIYSFQSQGMAFANRLRELDVSVESRFFNAQSEKVSHEYQFNYKTKIAQQTYIETRNFVNRFK